jgi:hypothetical protein
MKEDYSILSFRFPDSPPKLDISWAEKTKKCKKYKCFDLKIGVYMQEGGTYQQLKGRESRGRAGGSRGR